MKRTKDGKIDWGHYGLLAFYLGLYVALLTGLALVFWR